MAKPWACKGCGELGIHNGRGTAPTRCDECKRRHRTEYTRTRRAAARQALNELGHLPPEYPASLLELVDPEPFKEQAAAPKGHGGYSIPTGWSRRGKIPMDLSGMPDVVEDLPGARIWIMEHKFGVRLYAWQRRDMYRIGGWRRPTQAYWQLGRKNGKSLFACAVILTDLVLGHALPSWKFMPAYIVAVSESERSLSSAMGMELKNLIGRSAEADRAFIVTTSRIEYPHSGSLFELKPNKFSQTQSINPTMAVIDEVHLQKDGQIWNGFVLAGGMANYMVLGITTPGYDLASFAHDLYTRARAAGDPDLVANIYEPLDLACDSGDRAAWKRSNPRLEDDPGFVEVIEKQHRTMPEDEFRRFRLGIWTATEAAWLPHGAWDACRGGVKITPATAGPNQRVYLGFDGSYSGDSTALLAACGTHVTVAGAWENPGHKGWRVPRDEVEDVVARWMGASRHVHLLPDPPYWLREIGEWTQRWPGRVIEFPTNTRARMAPACTTFYAAVMERTLTHDGDPRLARHISNAVVKSSPQGDYITKPDPNSPAKIDLAVAAVVAFSASSAAAPRRAPVYVA